MAEIHDQFDTILILDFGSQVCITIFHFWRRFTLIQNNFLQLQYSHLITRRCREHNVYAELMPCTTKIKDIHFKPKGSYLTGNGCRAFWSMSTTGIILSGSPYSVYDEGSPHVDPAVFELGVPILGICYGLQVRWEISYLLLERCLPTFWTGTRLEPRRRGL